MGKKIQSREKIQPMLMGENLLREKDQTIYNESAGKAARGAIMPGFSGT